jgi:hypothetical protein
MGRKALLWLLVLGGLGLVAASLLADMVGLGGSSVFGWEQKLGVAAGMTVAWFSGLRLLGWHPSTRLRGAGSEPVGTASVSA